MEQLTFVLTALGPARRPSVTQWLLRETCHVLIGPPTEACRGTGDDHNEFHTLETVSCKFIHFFDVSGIDVAIKEFGWRRSVVYNFGYHIGLVDNPILRTFCGKLASFMQSTGITIKFTSAQDHLTTIYLEHLSVTSDRSSEIDCARQRAGLANSQRIYIGDGSMWDTIAKTVTNSFTDFSDFMGKEFSKASGLRSLEEAMSSSDELRSEWIVRYRYALLGSEYVRLLTDTVTIVDGATFWLDFKAYDNIRDELRASVVGNHSPHRSQWEMVHGLNRLVPVLEVVMPPGIHIEVRYAGSTQVAPKMHDLDEDPENHISMSSVCLSCCRIMPDLSRTDLELLRNPEKTGIVRYQLTASTKRAYYPCCFEAMMNPLTMDIPQYDPFHYNMNPTLPPEPSDMRTIISSTHFPPSSSLLPLDRLVWASGFGTSINYEHVPVRRYICRLNYPQISVEDFKLLNTHPEGFVDHMATYYFKDGSRALNAHPKRAARPISELVYTK